MIEVDRTVSAVGFVALANKQISVGYALAGRRVTLRFDGRVMAVLDPADRTLLRTVPNPLTTRSVAYLRGARPAGPPPTPPTAGPVTVERIVSSSGGIMVTRQRRPKPAGHRPPNHHPGGHPQTSPQPLSCLGPTSRIR